MRTLDDMAADMARYNAHLEEVMAAHLAESKRAAVAEREYRLAKGTAWARSYDEPGIKQAAHREAWVDAETADLRYARDMAASVSRSAWGAIRARMAQINSLQSEMANYRSESDLAGKGPR